MGIRFRQHFAHYPSRCTFFLALLAATMQGFAQDENQIHNFNDRLTALENKVKEGKIYNSSSRAEVVKGYNLFLTGEFLYLQAEENGLEYAVKSNDPTFSAGNEKFDYQNLDFDYHIGFRAGIGYNIPHDSWDLYAYWTHYNTDAEGHSHTADGEGLFPTWGFFSPGSNQTRYALNANARLRLNLNIIDVELGREYTVGKWLNFRPSMGIRTGFIDQHYHVVYRPIILEVGSGFAADDIKLKNDYWGVGPKAGIDTQWVFGRGFCIYGSAAISLLFGEFEIRRSEFIPNSPFSNKAHHDFHQVRAITDIAIGIGWDIMLAHDQYHLSIRGGYEQHLYFGQNQFDRVYYTAFMSNIGSNLGDLSLQGWTASLRVDF
ncbi:MAG: hypothetical protein JSR39_07970 [Verrucomicrobia bacterium]|nr:hypothetical protein [Verrucomicrobiota bacterium]